MTYFFQRLPGSSRRQARPACAPSCGAMPSTIEAGGTYPRPFAAVSAALWDKYEGHRFVTNVEPLAAAVDAHGTLHCRRLLTMQGKLPMALRPLLGAKPLYLLEEVVVDAKVASAPAAPCAALPPPGPSSSSRPGESAARACVRARAAWPDCRPLAPRSGRADGGADDKPQLPKHHRVLQLLHIPAGARACAAPGCTTRPRSCALPLPELHPSVAVPGVCRGLHNGRVRAAP